MPIGRTFAEIRQRTVAAVDARFAETVRLLPLRNGLADKTRGSVDISAPLRAGPGVDVGVSGGKQQDWQSNIAGGTAELHIDRSRYPALVVRKGDRLIAVDRPGEPVFEVQSFQDRGDTRSILYLSQK